MAQQLACPRCDFVLERPTGESPPTHCPACNGRLTCPRCGSPLQRHPEETALFHCSTCQADLAGSETGILFPADSGKPAFDLEVPGYEIQGELGRGGMGIVYRARQLSPDRPVAIKVLPLVYANNPTLLARFRKEANLAARLVDSHILPVYDVPLIKGVPVIVMPLIEGSDLGHILRDRAAIRRGRQLTGAHPWATLDDRAFLDQVLPILDQVVKAVVGLHRAGVLHRDIKPSNVLVDGRGNCWLSDFGLARTDDEGAGTRLGQGVGTAGYASPEQARGEGDVDFRSDVFSLGVTLYQALTLELPYGKKGVKSSTPPPIRPSRRQSHLAHDLDTVVLKALEPEQSSRYQSAETLQEDWAQVRKGLPPRWAKPAAWGKRLVPAARRHPWGILAGTTIALLVAVLGAMMIPSDPKEYRTVLVETEPKGARVVLVPLDPETSVPVPKRAIYPEALTPITIRKVPVGVYLVVAEVKGHGFHEVYRTVPLQGHPGHHGFFDDWEEQRDGTIQLPRISIPPSAVVKGMAFFQGGEFRMGTDALQGVPPYKTSVSPFFLDPTEVTVGEFKKAMKMLPPELANSPPPADFAVTYVNFFFALEYAERSGKRLPDEVEYEFAATEGGKKRFPWGNDATKITNWPLGKVKEPNYDKTATNPPAYGLFSNVAEWTDSRPTPYPTDSAESTDRVRDLNLGTRIIRGGPFPVVSGDPDPIGRHKHFEWDPRWRHSISPDARHPGLGFRCARSAKPRFLDSRK
jgi:serine/threonine protein kinase/formylglycine-generating enzyme required for sulfatase activity